MLRSSSTSAIVIDIVLLPAFLAHAGFSQGRFAALPFDAARSLRYAARHERRPLRRGPEHASRGVSRGQQGPVVRSVAPGHRHARRRCTGISARPRWSSRRWRAARACSPRTARWSSRPASTPAARPRTSSSSATPRPKHTIWWDNNALDDARAFRRAQGRFPRRARRARTTLFVQDLYGGSQPEHRVRVRVINELAWHSLFIRTLLVRPDAERAGRLRARIHDHRPAELPRRSRRATAPAPRR